MSKVSTLLRIYSQDVFYKYTDVSKTYKAGVYISEIL